MALNKILAVIPARGGSKGVPRKNIRMVHDKPLIAWTIEAALRTTDKFCDIIISTDDPEIASVAKDYGASVPFLRSSTLSGDKVPMIDVLRHAVQHHEHMYGYNLDWVCLLQPTVPMRTTEDIRAAIKIAETTEADSVISVVQVQSTHPNLMKKIKNGSLVSFAIEEKEGTRRQDYKPDAYMRNGAIYLTRRDTIIKHSSIWGKAIHPFIMPENRSVNIDSPIDLKLCEVMMKELDFRGAVD